MNTLVMAMFGLSLPAMMIGNPLTYAFSILALLLAFGLPQVRDTAGINATLSGLWRSHLAWAVGLLLLALYIGTLTAIKPEYSVRHWTLMAVMAGIGALLYHVFRRFDVSDRTTFVTWLVWGVQASYILAFAIAAAEPWAKPHGYYGEKPWTETHLRFYSSVLAVVLPFCWMMWLRPVRDGVMDLSQKAYRSGLLWVCSSFVMVLLCAGRAGWLGVIAAALVWLVMMKRFHGLRLPKPGQMLGLAVGTLAVSGVGYFLLYGKKSIEERIGVTIPDRGLGGGRLDIWHLAYQHVYDQPWFGLGMNSFRFLPGADFHPHNFVIQLWLEGGIVGLVLAFAVLGLIACRLYTRGRTDLVGVAGLAALAGFVISALTNKSIFNPEWIVVLLITMAFALSSARDGKVVVAKPVTKEPVAAKAEAVKVTAKPVVKTPAKAKGKPMKRKKGKR